MRRRTALTLAFAAGVAVVVFLAVRPAGRGRRDRGPAPGARGPVGKGEWRIFRGSTGMLGVASGALPARPALRWKFKTGGPVGSSPVVAAGRVYVGSGDANVYCLDLATGKKLWHFATRDSVDAPPTVVDDTVYVGSADGFLYALDAKAGTLRWKIETEDKILGAANTFRDAKTGKSRIVVGSYDYNLYCLDPADGKTLWKYESGNYINGGIAVAGGRTVFGGCDAVIHVVGPDGKDEGKIDAGAYVAATPAFDGKRVYVGNYEGSMVCADVEARKVVWTYEREDPFVSSPAVGAERLLAGCRDGRLYCLDRKTGKKRWSFATRAEVDSSPVICGEKVVFGSGDGRLYIVSLAEGKKLWSYELGDAIASSPAVAGGLILIGCNNGTLYAFGGK